MRLPFLLLVLSLSACGFHLRGASTLPADFNPLYVESADLSDQQFRLLEAGLNRASAQLTTNRDEANRLYVSMKQMPLRRLVNSSPGAIELHRMEMQLDFHLQAPDGEMLIPRSNISQSADVELDSANVLSHAERTRKAGEGLTRSLIRGMIFQLKRR